MLILILLILICSNAVNTRTSISILYSRLTIISLLFTSFLGYNNLYMKPLDTGIGIYGGLFHISSFTQTFNIFILLISSVILILTAFYPRKIWIETNGNSSIKFLMFKNLDYDKKVISNTKGEQYHIIEYALIIIFIISGAIFLMNSADLISVFLAIELQSYGLYILCTLYRDSESSTSSGLTYFLLGGLSSSFILFGSSLLYANTGTTNLDNIYIITGISEINNVFSSMYWYQSHYFHLSLIIMSVGLLFKISAAPFHFWSPDVYDGIPTIVTTFVAIVAKISIFTFLLELIFHTQNYFLNFTWQSIFFLSSFFSLIIGSVLGLTQFRIKRLLAYSTISHVGFMLLALSINTTESIQSYILYIIQYTISNLNSFIILISIGYTYFIYSRDTEESDLEDETKSIYAKSTKETGDTNKSDLKNKIKDENNSPIQITNQIKGYFYINPFIAISLTITLFSFIGIPPMIGFFAKQMILSAALDKGYIFITFIAILTSVIGAGYYLNLIKELFFQKSEYKKDDLFLAMKSYVYPRGIEKKGKNIYNSKNKEYFTWEHITLNSSLSSSISILTLLLLLFIFTPQEWFNFAASISLLIFNS